MKKTLKVILVGAGNRGQAYTNIMASMPDQFQVVAVAEPVESRRNYIRDTHHIPEEFCVSDWKELIHTKKLQTLS